MPKKDKAGYLNAGTERILGPHVCLRTTVINHSHLSQSSLVITEKLKRTKAIALYEIAGSETRRTFIFLTETDRFSYHIIP